MKLPDDAQLQTSKTRQRMQLSDGRTLAFDEYGAADGFPFVYMHGTPGSPSMRRKGISRSLPDICQKY